MEGQETRARRAVRHGIGFGMAMVCLSVAMARDPSGITSVVTVLPDRYVSADLQFTDLDALGVLIDMVAPSLLQVDVCGAAATAPFMAAVEAFHEHRLEIHLRDSDWPSCVAGAGARIAKVAELPPAGREPVAARPGRSYWRQLQP